MSSELRRAASVRANGSTTASTSISWRLYLERFMSYGLTLEELTRDRPIVGISQGGSDLTPCNRIHLDLARRVKGSPFS